MKERPILFNSQMVRAILSGQKTQTRRVVKPQTIRESLLHEQRPHWIDSSNGHVVRCPYGQPGDRLWVREAIRLVPNQEPDDGTGRVDSVYEADGALTAADAWPWKRSYLPPIHCPRGLSRILLEIVSVRVERLQDISRGDAMAEGCPFPNIAKENDPREWFLELWESINGPESWAANPWIWVIEFKVIQH